MITLQEVEELARKLKTNQTVVFREYLQLLFLANLYATPKSEKVFFKGGTAVHLLWNSFRFSEDLDFTVDFSESRFSSFIAKVFSKMLLDKGLTVKEKKTIAGKSYLLTYSGDVLPFKVFVSLDFSFREKPRLTSHTFVKTNFPIIFTSFVYHLMPEEVLAEKVRAILTRKKGRDFFDLWFLLAKGIKVDWRLVAQKMDYYPQARWTKEKLQQTIWEYSLSDFKKDLRPFLPLDQRAKLKNIYEVSKKVSLEALRE